MIVLGNSVAVVGQSGISWIVNRAPSHMKAFQTSRQPFLIFLLIIAVSLSGRKLRDLELLKIMQKEIQHHDESKYLAEMFFTPIRSPISFVALSS